jgi:hypothetical protein
MSRRKSTKGTGPSSVSTITMKCGHPNEVRFAAAVPSEARKAILSDMAVKEICSLCDHGIEEPWLILKSWRINSI